MAVRLRVATMLRGRFVLQFSGVSLSGFRPRLCRDHHWCQRVEVSLIERLPVKGWIWASVVVEAKIAVVASAGLWHGNVRRGDRLGRI